MFENARFESTKAFTKVSQPATVEAVDSQFVPLGEKPKWSLDHKIERNLEGIC
jgi:biotin synthase